MVHYVAGCGNPPEIIARTQLVLTVCGMWYAFADLYTLLTRAH